MPRQDPRSGGPRPQTASWIAPLPPQHAAVATRSSSGTCAGAGIVACCGACRRVAWLGRRGRRAVSYTHLRAHETSAHL
eukprot:6114005-Alexandrium_andersonii.AAC.1